VDSGVSRCNEVAKRKGGSFDCTPSLVYHLPPPLGSLASVALPSEQARQFYQIFRVGPIFELTCTSIAVAHRVDHCICDLTG